MCLPKRYVLSNRYHFEHNGACAPGTPFLDQTFSPCNVLSCSDVFSMYCAILLRCFLQVLRFLPRRFLYVMCFPAQMFFSGTPFLSQTFSSCNVLFCSDVFSRYSVSCSDVFSRNSDSSTIKTHHSDINTSNPNTYYVLQSMLVTSVALSFVLIVTNM